MKMARNVDKQVNSLLSILELPKCASPDDTISAFLKQALKCHPEQDSSTEAAEKFRELSYAFSKLLTHASDPNSFKYSYCSTCQCIHKEKTSDHLLEEEDFDDCDFDDNLYDYDLDDDDDDDEYLTEEEDFNDDEDEEKKKMDKFFEDIFYVVLRERVMRQQFTSKKKKKKHIPTPEEEEQKSFFSLLFGKRKNEDDGFITEEDLKKFHSYDEWKKARDPKKRPNQRTRKAKKKANKPVLEKPKQASKKELLALQIKREKEAEKIRLDLEKKNQDALERDQTASKMNSSPCRKKDGTESIVKRSLLEKTSREMEELKHAQERGARLLEEQIDAIEAKKSAAQRRQRKKEARQLRKKNKIVANSTSSTDSMEESSLKIVACTVNGSVDSLFPEITNPTPLLPSDSKQKNLDKVTTHSLKEDRDQQLQSFLEKVKQHKLRQNKDQQPVDESPIPSPHRKEANVNLNSGVEVKQDLLSKHLQQYKELMKQQPCRHTEEQIRQERRRKQRDMEEIHQQEVERLRQASKIETYFKAKPDVCQDSMEQQEELMRLERTKDSSVDPDIVDIEERYGGVKTTDHNKFTKKNPKQKVLTWKPYDGWCASLPPDQPHRPVVRPDLPRPAPAPVTNAWGRRRELLDSLRPSNHEDEEEMLRQALEISRQEAIQEQKRCLEAFKAKAAEVRAQEEAREATRKRREELSKGANIYTAGRSVHKPTLDKLVKNTVAQNEGKQLMAQQLGTPTMAQNLGKSTFAQNIGKPAAAQNTGQTALAQNLGKPAVTQNQTRQKEGSDETKILNVSPDISTKSVSVIPKPDNVLVCHSGLYEVKISLPPEKVAHRGTPETRDDPKNIDSYSVVGKDRGSKVNDGGGDRSSGQEMGESHDMGLDEITLLGAGDHRNTKQVPDIDSTTCNNNHPIPSLLNDEQNIGSQEALMKSLGVNTSETAPQLSIPAVNDKNTMYAFSESSASDDWDSEGDDWETECKAVNIDSMEDGATAAKTASCQGFQPITGTKAQVDNSAIKSQGSKENLEDENKLSEADVQVKPKGAAAKKHPRFLPKAATLSIGARPKQRMDSWCGGDKLATSTRGLHRDVPAVDPEDHDSPQSTITDTLLSSFGRESCSLPIKTNGVDIVTPITEPPTLSPKDQKCDLSTHAYHDIDTSHESAILSNKSDYLSSNTDSQVKQDVPTTVQQNLVLEPAPQSFPSYLNHGFPANTEPLPERVPSGPGTIMYPIQDPAVGFSSPSDSNSIHLPDVDPALVAYYQQLYSSIASNPLLLPPGTVPQMPLVPQLPLVPPMLGMPPLIPTIPGCPPMFPLLPPLPLFGDMQLPSLESLQLDMKSLSGAGNSGAFADLLNANTGVIRMGPKQDTTTSLNIGEVPFVGNSKSTSGRGRESLGSSDPAVLKYEKEAQSESHAQLAFVDDSILKSGRGRDSLGSCDPAVMKYEKEAKSESQERHTSIDPNSNHPTGDHSFNDQSKTGTIKENHMVSGTLANIHSETNPVSNNLPQSPRRMKHSPFVKKFATLNKNFELSQFRSQLRQPKLSTKCSLASSFNSQDGTSTARQDRDAAMTQNGDQE